MLKNGCGYPTTLVHVKILCTNSLQLIKRYNLGPRWGKLLSFPNKKVAYDVICSSQSFCPISNAVQQCCFRGWIFSYDKMSDCKEVVPYHLPSYLDSYQVILLQSQMQQQCLIFTSKYNQVKIS